MPRARRAARAPVALLVVAARAAGPGYDCSDTLQAESWSQPQKDVCCIIKGVGCQPVAPSKGGTTTTVPGTSVTIYDCTTGKEGWGATQQDWCCEHWNLGCSGSPPKGGDKPGPDGGEVGPGGSTIYDCKEDLEQWRTKWEQSKQDWCCAHWDLGCSSPGASEGDSGKYECEEGILNWQNGWSNSKKAYCCQHASEEVRAQLRDGDGCTVTTPQPPTVKPDNAPKCQAIVFQNPDLTGWTATFAPGAFDNPAYVSAGAVSEAGAVTVNDGAKGCTAFLYGNGDFTGWSAMLGPGSYGVKELKEAGGNGSIGSIKVLESNVTTTTTATTSATSATTSSSSTSTTVATTTSSTSSKSAASSTTTTTTTSEKPKAPATTATATATETTTETTTTSASSASSVDEVESSSPPSTDGLLNVGLSASPVYDCLEGYDYWETQWNAEKKAYCCEKHDSCNTTTTSKPATSTTTATTTETEPYSCFDDIGSWETTWPGPKKEWCCANRVFCPGPSGNACAATVYEKPDLTGWKATFSPGQYDAAAFSKAGAASHSVGALVVANVANGSKCCSATAFGQASDGNAQRPFATLPGGSYDAGKLASRGIPDGVVDSLVVSETCSNSQMLPSDLYDCSEDLASWETKWDEKKKAWCCAHRVLCPSSPEALQFDCKEGLDNANLGWSDEKKEFCCQKEQLGCPFDCKAGALLWRTGWSDDKKEYCCRTMGTGCPFDCQVAKETWRTSWVQAQKDWCCKHSDDGIGCPATTTTAKATTVTTTTVTTTTVTTTTATTEGPACYDTPGWTNGFGDCKTEDNSQEGCTAAGYTCDGYTQRGFCRGGLVLQNVTAGSKYHHPESNCCACGGGFRAKGYVPEKVACKDPSDWPDLVGMADCGPCKHVVSAENHSTCASYCQSIGMQCFHAAEDHPTQPGSLVCPVKANATCNDDVAAMAQSQSMICGCRDPTKEVAVGGPLGSGQASPYDCAEGVAGGWSELKTSWCCTNMKLGCSTVTSSTTTISTTLTTTTSTASTSTTASSTVTTMPFDCKEEKVPEWEDDERAWCCEHHQLGCTTTHTTTASQTTAAPFDCEVGLDDWENKWPHPQKQWCCKNHQRGCTPIASTTSAPFDCRAGLWNWREGWSDKKKDWCCTNEKLGCQKPETTTTAPGGNNSLVEPVTAQFDCFQDLKGWRDKWSSEKLQYCCQHEADCPSFMEEAFDCWANISSWKDSWSTEQKKFCCGSHFQCPEKVSGIDGSGAKEFPWDAAAGGYKCEGLHGVTGSVTAGKAEAMNWCCRHKRIGCHVAEGEFDCWANISTWEDSWSAEQKKFCCGSHFQCPGKVPGVDVSGAKEFPWDAAAGGYKCEGLHGITGTVTAGKAEAMNWCCEHKKIGCHLVEGEFDCWANISTWEDSWSAEQKKFCCGSHFQCPAKVDGVDGSGAKDFPWDAAAGGYKCEGLDGVTGSVTAGKAEAMSWCCEHKKIGCRPGAAEFKSKQSRGASKEGVAATTTTEKAPTVAATTSAEKATTVAATTSAEKATTVVATTVAVATTTAATDSAPENFDRGDNGPSEPEHYDCEEGLLDSMNGWTVAKYEWCCHNQQIGCLDDADIISKSLLRAGWLPARGAGRSFVVVLALGFLGLVVAAAAILRGRARRRFGRYHTVDSLSAVRPVAQDGESTDVSCWEDAPAAALR